MVLGDCCSLFELPEELRTRPCMTIVMDFAMTTAIQLANSFATPHLASDSSLLAEQLTQLPLYVRLEMLQRCCLKFPAMCTLLRSEQQITDSEDSLAMLLADYLRSDAGIQCSASEITQLKQQIRYQHLSTLFVAFELPGIRQLSLDKEQLSQLLYIRDARRFLPMPSELRQPNVPNAWYKLARDSPPSDNSVKLVLYLSEKALSHYLKGVARLKSGGAAPSDVHSLHVECKGTSWCMKLQSLKPDSQFCFAVQPTFNKKLSLASQRAGLVVCVIFRVENVHPMISRHTGLVLAGKGGVGIDNFVQDSEKRLGDPTELDWWRKYIKDGHIRFSATVEF